MGIRNVKSILLTRRSLLQTALVANTVLVARPWPASASTSQGPVVETIYGKVRGSRVDEINIFKGIPYGASTAGGNRFRPPQKPQAWRGVRDALHLDPSRPKTPMRRPVTRRCAGFRSARYPMSSRRKAKTVSCSMSGHQPLQTVASDCHGDVSWRRVRRGQG